VPVPGGGYVYMIKPIRVRFKRLYKKSSFQLMDSAFQRFFKRFDGNGLYYKARILPFGDFRRPSEKTGWRL